MKAFSLSSVVEAEIARQLAGVVPPAVTPAQVAEAAQSLGLATEPAVWGPPSPILPSWLGRLMGQQPIKPLKRHDRGEEKWFSQFKSEDYYYLPHLRVEELGGEKIVGGWGWSPEEVTGSSVRVRLTSTTHWEWVDQRFSWSMGEGKVQAFPPPELTKEGVSNQLKELDERFPRHHEVVVKLPWEISTLPEALLHHPGLALEYAGGTEYPSGCEYRYEWVPMFYAPAELEREVANLLWALSKFVGPSGDMEMFWHVMMERGWKPPS